MGKIWAKSIFRLVPLFGPYLWALALKISWEPKYEAVILNILDSLSPEEEPEIRLGNLGNFF